MFDSGMLDSGMLDSAACWTGTLHGILKVSGRSGCGVGPLFICSIELSFFLYSEGEKISSLNTEAEIKVD